MSADGKKQNFPIPVQNSIHRLSASGGKTEEDFDPADFRFVPTSDISTSTLVCIVLPRLGDPESKVDFRSLLFWA